MKILRYTHGGQPAFGVLEPDGTIRALERSPFESLEPGRVVAKLDEVQVLFSGFHGLLSPARVTQAGVRPET